MESEIYISLGGTDVAWDGTFCATGVSDKGTVKEISNIYDPPMDKAEAAIDALDKFITEAIKIINSQTMVKPKVLPLVYPPGA
jgi:hypothetical protein